MCNCLVATWRIRRAIRRLATVWLRDMETVERHVTLPADLDEAWELLTDPDDLAGWLGARGRARARPRERPGRVVDHDGTRAAPGRRRGRGGPPPRLALVGRGATDADQPGGDHAWPRPSRAPPCAWSRTLAAGRPARPRRGAAGAARGLVAPAPAPRGAPPGRRRRPGVTSPADAEARAAAVFEALADPTRRAVLRDVAEHGPAHGHRAGRRAARQPSGRRQAPGGAARRRARDVGASRPRDAVHRHAGAARRGRPVARPHRPGLGGAPGPPRGASDARRPSTAERRPSASRRRPPAGARRPDGRLRSMFVVLALVFLVVPIVEIYVIAAGGRRHRRARDDPPAHRHQRRSARGSPRWPASACSTASSAPCGRARCRRPSSSTARSCCSPAR